MPLLAALLALAPIQATDPLVGTWRGTSLCQVRPSPCNDETAVYHFTAAGDHRYHMAMNKMVGGVEAEMGVLEGEFDPATGVLSAVSYNRQNHPAHWQFRLDGNRLHGTLTSTDGVVYRRIEVTRDPG